jgi:acyl-coenzyme A synthetase/AMP-(fatty) acid ligase
MDSTAYLWRPASDDSGVLRGLTMPVALASAVTTRRNAPAVIQGGSTLTWGQIGERTADLAARLRAAGFGPGDVIGVHLPNCWAFLVAHLAIAETGAVMLPLHLPYRERELATYLAFAQAHGVIMMSGAAEAMLAAVRADLPSLAVHVVVDLESAAQPFTVHGELDAGAREAGPLVAPDDPLCLIPTSGTESLKPKLCMHSHDGLLSNAVAFAESVHVTSEDRLLVGSGYTHLFGMLGVHLALVRAATLIAVPAYSADAYLDAAERHGATMAWAVPAQLTDLAAARERVSSHVLRLREVRTGGAPIAAELADRVRASLCENLVVHWGMSELGGGITTTGLRLEPKLIGVPLPGAQARVVDAAGNETAPGETGELLYRRADMFRGYYHDEATTAASITPDGWLRTGDLAARDVHGRIWYEGREKDLINRGGYKISAYEIEALLGGLAAIRQAAVVCVPDERLGEKGCLCVALHPGASLALAEVGTHLEARGLAKYKWPEHLLVLDELPVTPTGKIAKKVLRALAAERVRESVPS